MSLDESLARACEAVPGLLRAALALLPEGLLIGSIGAKGALEHEPLVRTAKRCFEAPRAAPRAEPFVEFVFVTEDQFIAIQAGRQDARLALIVACSREATLGYVLDATRKAMRSLEQSVDLARLGV
ncbi:MAG: hypothetical protein QM756_38700 [Polyangiaceae bacterium]